MKHKSSPPSTRDSINSLMTQIKDYTKNKYVNLEALEKINQLFIVNQNNLTPDQINDIVAEYAQIEVIKPTFLVKEILPFIIKNQSLLKLSSQIKISHLFAKKDLYSEEFCRQMVSNFNNSAGTLTPSELVDMQWSLSKIRYFNQNFFQEWRNRIAPYVRSLENHELTKSILAIAKNDYYSENLVNEFVNILKDRDLNNHDLVSAIYSLSLIMETKNQPSLQTDIHELLQKVNLSSISTTIEMRQLISSYNSLSSSYKETLTKFHPELDIWKKHLHKEDQPTISRSQSFIKDLLTKYDLEAQEEVWLESLATNIDIYLPSIRTYVQVDGPTHFYRNDSSHYTTTSQFNSSFLRKEEDKHLLRISNLNPRSYRKVVAKALNDRFFESNALTQTSSAFTNISNEDALPPHTNEMATSSSTKAVVSESLKKTSATHKPTQQNRKKDSNHKKKTEEDQFLMNLPFVDSSAQTTTKNYTDQIRDLTKKHKINMGKDRNNNLFQAAITEMNFELAAHLVTNYNVTKIDNFIKFLENEASKENFNDHPQFEYSIKIFNTVIEKNLLNEVYFMQKMIDQENIIKFVSYTNYDFDKAFDCHNNCIRNAASFMLMEKGYFDTVISLIKNEKLTHACDNKITLPLVLCALYYDPKNKDEMIKQKMCLETLLENNFSPEVYDVDFTTPILYCIINAAEYKNINTELYQHFMNLSSLLLSYDVSIAVKPLAQGGNLLMGAVGAESEELVSKLLATNLPYGIDDVSHDPTGQNCSPLYIAIMTSNVRITELLLQNGASPEGEFDIKQYDMNLFSPRSRTISGNKANQTPLFIAVEFNAPKIINLLVKYGADINRPNKTGLTVMHKIVQEREYALCETVIQNGFYNEKSFKILLERAQNCSEKVKAQIRTYQSDPVSFILQADELAPDNKIRSLNALLNAESLPKEHKAKASVEIDRLKTPIHKKITIASDSLQPAKSQNFTDKINQERQIEQNITKGIAPKIAKK